MSFAAASPYEHGNCAADRVYLVNTAGMELVPGLHGVSSTMAGTVDGGFSDTRDPGSANGPANCLAVRMLPAASSRPTTEFRDARHSSDREACRSTDGRTRYRPKHAASRHVRHSDHAGLIPVQLLPHRRAPAPWPMFTRIAKLSCVMWVRQVARQMPGSIIGMSCTATDSASRPSRRRPRCLRRWMASSSTEPSRQLRTQPVYADCRVTVK